MPQRPKHDGSPTGRRKHVLGGSSGQRRGPRHPRRRLRLLLDARRHQRDVGGEHHRYPAVWGVRECPNLGKPGRMPAEWRVANGDLRPVGIRQRIRLRLGHPIRGQLVPCRIEFHTHLRAGVRQHLLDDVGTEQPHRPGRGLELRRCRCDHDDRWPTHLHRPRHQQLRVRIHPRRGSGVRGVQPCDRRQPRRVLRRPSCGVERFCERSRGRRLHRGLGT